MWSQRTHTVSWYIPCPFVLRSPRLRPRSAVTRRIRLGSTTPKNSGQNQPREEPWCEAGNQGQSPRSCPTWGHNCHILASGNGFPGMCEVVFTWNPSGALYFPEDWEFSLLGGNEVLSIEQAAYIKCMLRYPRLYEVEWTVPKLARLRPAFQGGSKDSSLNPC